MADLSGFNVPKERPVPQQAHLDAANAEETYKTALRITLAKIQSAYVGNEPMKDGPEMFKAAKAYVEKHGAANIMEEHNKPSEADLDAVAEEQKIAVATEKKSAAWGKTASTKKQ